MSWLNSSPPVTSQTIWDADWIDGQIQTLWDVVPFSWSKQAKASNGWVKQTQSTSTWSKQ